MLEMITFDLDDDGRKMLPSLSRYIKMLAKAYRNGNYYSRSSSKRQLIGDSGNKYDVFFSSPEILDTFELYQQKPRKLEKLVTKESNKIRIGFGWSKNFNKSLTIETKQGDDHIILEGSGAKTTYIEAGNGNDVITTYERSRDVIINGGNGVDTFNFWIGKQPKNLTVIEDFDPDVDTLSLKLSNNARDILAWHSTSDGFFLSEKGNSPYGLTIKGVTNIEDLPTI